MARRTEAEEAAECLVEERLPAVAGAGAGAVVTVDTGRAGSTSIWFEAEAVEGAGEGFLAFLVAEAEAEEAASEALALVDEAWDGRALVFVERPPALVLEAPAEEDVVEAAVAAAVEPEDVTEEPGALERLDGPTFLLPCVR